jgi:hypothetical protein
MRERRRYGSSLIDRVARVAFTFLVMNCSAVAGLGVILLRKRVWRES